MIQLISFNYSNKKYFTLVENNKMHAVSKENIMKLALQISTNKCKFCIDINKFSCATNISDMQFIKKYSDISVFLNEYSSSIMYYNILSRFFTRSAIKNIIDVDHRINIVFEGNTVSSYTKNDIIKIVDRERRDLHGSNS